MRKAVAKFGSQLAKLDNSQTGGSSGSGETEKKVGMGMGMQVAELDASIAADALKRPISPRSRIVSLREAALGSHPPPVLASGPRAGEGIFDIAPSTRILLPASIHSRHGRGSLKRRLNRVGTAFGIHVDLPPPDPELFAFGSDIRYHQQEQQASSNRLGRGFSDSVDGNRARNPLWKFGTGRKREEERPSGVLEGNSLGMSRCDSLQQKTGSLGGVEGAEKRQGGGERKLKKRMRMR
jgi:hypothetical protein